MKRKLLVGAFFVALVVAFKSCSCKSSAPRAAAVFRASQIGVDQELGALGTGCGGFGCFDVVMNGNGGAAFGLGGLGGTLASTILVNQTWTMFITTISAWVNSELHLTGSGAGSLVRITDVPFVVGGGVAGDETFTMTGHRFAAGAAPSVSSCGPNLVQPAGDDGDGYFTTGTAATTCTFTFAVAYGNKPACIVHPEGTPTQPTYTVTKNGISFAVNIGSTTYHYHCVDPNR